MELNELEVWRIILFSELKVLIFWPFGAIRGVYVLDFVLDWAIYGVFRVIDDKTAV